MSRVQCDQRQHSDPCRVRIEECLRVTPGPQSVDLRSVVTNEPLADEIKRNEKKRGEAAEAHEKSHLHRKQHQHHMN